MPPRKAAAPKAQKAHASVSVAAWYAGSIIVFVSAALCYALAQAGGDPLVVAGRMVLMHAALCLLASWLTWDHSWHARCVAMRAPLRCLLAQPLTPRCCRVDRLWSVTPVFYTLHFARAGDWAPRLTLMAALALLWGARLSWNFARKAGYQARACDAPTAGGARVALMP